MKALHSHRSIRRYKSTPIDESLLNEILQAGIRASTTGNMQVYSIIVTKSQEVKQQLLPCHFNQQMVVEAPVVLTFCADFNRFNKWCGQRKAEPGYDNFISFFTGAIDALLVAQNVCIAAEENGLGICYLGTTTYTADRIVEVLKLPKGVVPITTVVMGYPDESPELTDRLPLAGVVHHEVYQDYSEGDIDQIYMNKESLQLTKKLLEENGKETLAQIFTDIRYTRADNLLFSKVFLKTIEQQGFMNNK
ncbi:MAG: nitroreductase family protein [Bacteroidales bacterium]|jgi:nitroreductase|nr:nitroreductase family protein [Bacteroidales bacterium]HNT42153.1 nitroreductase family protein [Tenuifilaceae bacterium]MBP8643345.1 nitroreductase family protein [Bacteroidales bacterium]NLI88168.1 NADPH-dependent oxidoreductase [Bacteroidales bacterium]HOA09545.1 nitroreductase family protein [Tenuifilaceae bacterium]